MTVSFFAGVALDSADGKDISIIKKQGKVKALEEEIFYRKCSLLSYSDSSVLHFLTRRSFFSPFSGKKYAYESPSFLGPRVKFVMLVRYQYRLRVQDAVPRWNRSHAMGDARCAIGGECSSSALRQRARLCRRSQW